MNNIFVLYGEEAFLVDKYIKSIVTSKKINTIINNVDKVKSNIAKYSLIQCVREMNMLSFPIKIIEIEKRLNKVIEQN